MFAANYLWPGSTMTGEMLVIVLRLESGHEFDEALRRELAERNRRLPDFKRVRGYVIWEADFPRTASLKIKRIELAEQIRASTERARRWLSCEPAVLRHREPGRGWRPLRQARRPALNACGQPGSLSKRTGRVAPATASNSPATPTAPASGDFSPSAAMALPTRS